MTFSMHAANHLRVRKQIEKSLKWVYGGVIADVVEHVRVMICVEKLNIQREKIVAKTISVKSHEQPCDPTELVDESREV